MIELLTVIAIIALLAGMLVGLAGLAGNKSKTEAVKAQLQEYVTAIENYHAQLGFYPPDNRDPKTGLVNTAINPLFYELNGVVLTNRDTLYVTKSGLDSIPVSAVPRIFNRDGFANASRDISKVPSFLSNLKPDRYAEISTSPEVEVLKVPVDWPANRAQFPPPLKTNGYPAKVWSVNPWHYDASSPRRHNLNSFDLWAEVVIGNHLEIIGNWKQ